MPRFGLRSLLCLWLLLPLLAAGAQAAADPLAGRAPQPPKACCAAMAAACGCPAGAPCQVDAAPSLPAPEAALSPPARPQAPALSAGQPALDLASAHPSELAAALLPDPPPQERYLRLAVLRI
ncbi:MAG: hypothetical protein ACOZHQ_05310 [Thermodesulfobacteriota bacterium]